MHVVEYPAFFKDQDPGGRTYQCDAIHHYRYDGSGITSVALLDGIGDRAHVADAVQYGAWYAARAAARTSPTLGLLAASAAFVDTAYLRDTDGKRAGITEDTCAAVVNYVPHVGFRYAYIGDVRVYTLLPSPTGIELVLLTEDHNRAQRSRALGASAEEIAEGAGAVRCTLSMAISPTCIGEGEAPSGTVGVLMTTDGVHDALSHNEMTDIVQGSMVNCRDIPTALVTSAVKAAGDEADNASVVLMYSP